ncbi:hypothetical protein P43SY_002972 [Pythium insidiosum]|uniref:Uncharacterized protein n=1 Tax=Pythium insidiosum TaxID=114742 RepID=A0AAD5LD59_PYTIN|nr:hypothetical protein P43SY_002972 [Pythium insidiosum]
MSSTLPPVPAYASASASAPGSSQDLERRTFLRACSRKSLESSPEDEELFVGDDGTIAVVTVDDQTRIERLRQLLERKERETRQAAEYGLSLLEVNEELQLQVASLKIQLEADTADLAAERELYRRRHESALLDVDSWKRKCVRLQEELYEQRQELERVAAECSCRQRQSEDASRDSDRIRALETTIEEMRANESSHLAQIAALHKAQDLAETKQREWADAALAEADSERLYAKRLEADHAKMRRLLEDAQSDRARLLTAAADAEATIKALRREIDGLHDELTARRHENNAQAERLHTAESKCSRLQRELALMEHVSCLSMAVIDRDDEEDDDDDEDDDEEEQGGRKRQQDTAGRGRSSQPNQPAREDVHVVSDDDDSEWFSQPAPQASSSASSSAASASASARDAPVPVPVPSTPSSRATHEKLHHYFHLTALSIIHENDLHERIFASSSRATIDAWYREVVDQGVPFLEWHAWLINRISVVAVAIEAPPKRSSATSPFLAFRRRRRDSGFPGFRRAPDGPTRGAMPSPVTTNPSRVPFSVARTFFRLLGREQSNQEDGEA